MIIVRWPLLVFFATSGIAGVVYGFISPEWPLTLLSVGLTGKHKLEIASMLGGLYLNLFVAKIVNKYVN